MMKKHLLALSIGVALGTSPMTVTAAEHNASAEQIMQELEALKQRVENLQSELEQERARNDKIEQKQEEQAEKVAAAEEESGPDINVGGAVRFNYTVADNDQAAKDRGGDLKFDTFRLNFDGEINDVILSAEWRWYEYFTTIHHAWVGYEFTDELMAKAGVFQTPFGVLPYNSHNFYFSSLYYVGLEDNYDFGIGTTYTPGDWRFDLAFMKNDERTWGPEFDGSGDTDTYDANVIGYNGGYSGFTGDTDAETSAGRARTTQAINTLAARAEYDYKVSDKLTLKPGASVKYGQLEGDASQGDGDYYAAAAHLIADYDRWNVQLQYTDWEYDVDDPAAQYMTYGYYAGAYTGPMSAKALTANVAYTLPVEWGPVSSLTFYNDYSLIYDKNADYEDTYMNVTGMAVSAGGLYTYFDIINGKNQPFVANGMTSDGESNTIFNINVGYYF
ncbi:carbohydrate porin [Guyparkeria hydrothermalis]|uniref:carbohydrate porin n=1 Tax=Guyparkeria hydrothermalis TaxID=923 RepID=UPI0020210E3C|nr:carbohydrate porin [Guyparkeria hydrothermalis]MCL7743967.1 carbohydrate porin [Guyparkeria hydrothermalis]